MPTTIDDRVVRMSFDNRGFESGVRETMSSLEKLKDALSFNKSSSGMDLSGISSGIEQLNKKFSALGIAGMTVMQDITRSAEQMGKRLVNAVSMDAVKDGFREYELQMDSVKTIMASTGEDINTVNKYIDELNKYADKTIYSFSDMTNNIGKFTNAGIKLDDAVMAIKGIANEAAVSGANSQEASRAMYNFAQALSGGSVKLRDWMSIENANMATAEFKQQLIDAGVELGTLAKKSDGTYEVLTTNMNGAKMKETITNVKNFRDSLSYSWMTTEVLTKTLKNYADETTEIGKKAYDAAQDVTTFSKLIDTLQEALGSSWNKTFQLIFGDFEEAKKFWTDVSKAISEVVESFGDARNAMLQIWHDNGGRDAMIDSLKNTWNGLKEVMKVVGEAFRNVFPPMTGEKLIEFTKRIKELTSQFKLNTVQADTLRNIFTGLFSVIKILQRVAESIIKTIKPVGDILKPIITIFTLSLASIAKFITNVSKAGNMLDYALKHISDVFTDIIEIIKDWTNIDINAKLNIFNKGLIKLGDAGEYLQKHFASVVDTFKNYGIFDGLVESIYFVRDALKDGLFNLFNISESSIVGKSLSWLINSFKELGLTILDVGKYLLAGDFSSAFESIVLHINNIIPGFAKFIDGIKNIKEHIQNGLGLMKEKLEPLGQAFLNAGKSVKSFFDRFSNDGGESKGFGSFIKHLDIFEKVTTVVKNFGKLIKTAGSKIIQLGAKIGSIIPKMFGYLGSEDFHKILVNLNTLLHGGLLLALIKFINAINTKIDEDHNIFNFFENIKKTIDNTKKNIKGTVDSLKKSVESVTESFSEIKDKITGKEKDIGKTLLKIAGAIGIVTLSLVVLSNIDPEKLSHGLAALAIEVGILLGAFKVMQTLMSSDAFWQKSMNNLTTQMLKFAGVIAILTLSFKSLAELDINQVNVGLVGIVGLVATILIAVTYLGNLEKVGNFKQISKGLVTFAIGIRVLASSVKALGQLDIGSLTKGLLGVVALLEAINLFSQEANLSSLSVKAAASIFITMEAVKVLAKTVIIFAEMNWEEFTRGLLGIIALLGMVYMFTNEANLASLSVKAAASIYITIEAVKVLAKTAMIFGEMNWEEFTRGLLGVIAILEAVNLFTQEAALSNARLTDIVAILAITLAIKGIAGALISLSKVPFTSLVKSLIGLGGVLAAMVVMGGTLYVLSMMGPSVIIAALAIDVMSASLIILVPALKALSTISFLDMIGSLVGLAGAFIILAGAGPIFGVLAPLMVAGAVAISALGLAILVLVPGLKALSTISFLDMIKSVAGLGMAFTTLAIAGAAFGIVSPLMIAGAIAIGALGVATIATGVGLLAVATGITALAAALAAGAVGIVTGISVIVIGLVSLVPQIATAIANGIVIFAKTLLNGVTTIVESATVMVKAILNAIKELLPLIVDTALTVILSICKTVKDNLPKIVQIASEIIITFCQTIEKYLPKIAETAVKMVVVLLNSIANGIRKYGPEILAAVRNLLSSIIELVITALQDLSRLLPFVGGYLVDGLETAKTVVRETLAPESMNQIGSEAMGQNGLAGGIQSQEGTLNNVTSGIGNRIMGTLGGMLNKGNGFDIGSILGVDLSKGMGSTNALLGNSASAMSGNILTNLDVDTTDQGYLYGSKLASGIDLSQYDVTKATQGLTGNITSEFSDVNLDFEKIGTENISSYIDPFDSTSTQKNIKDSGANLADKGVAGVKSKRKDFVETGKDSGKGFSEGLDDNDVKKLVSNKASGLATTALNAIRKTMDSHSPSRESEKLGAFGGEGFALGLANMASVVKDKASNLGQSALDGMRLALANLSDMASAELITDPMIRPVLDLSEIQNGIGTMNGMFDSPIVGLRASFADTGATVKDLHKVANTLNISSNNDNVVGEVIALRKDVKNLGQSMSQMKLYMDSKEVGGVVSNEVDRRLGIRYLRNKREGRGY